MKIYTKTGDEGETGLFGGVRVSKDHARVEAYGAIDELNAVLGIARSVGLPADVEALAVTIQSQLFDVGSELAAVAAKIDKLKVPKVSEDDVAALEAAIDQAETELSPLTTFVLPAGSPAASQLHHARTVCRRAERRVVSLHADADGGVRPEVLRYLNRLSDLLFTWARLANHRANVVDSPWIGRDRAK
jgi:cob(I)alamin adenosyltransferase